jgi:hypothetical protein
MVENRPLEAADVLKRLPTVRDCGYYSLWPPIIPDFRDLVEREAPGFLDPPPSSDAVSRMEQTTPWLTWLEPQDARLVWARAERSRWKLICWRFGISRATAHRRWEYALSVITWRLNGKRPPVKRPRGFVVEWARKLSR